MKFVLFAAAIGLFTTLLLTPVAIRFFRVAGWGQRVREPGPHYPQHQGKMGTPTMGGLVIIGAMGLAYAAVGAIRGDVSMTGGLVMVAGAALAVLGFVDDLLKVRRQHSLGLGKAAKIGGQVLVALAFAFGLTQLTTTSTQLSFVRPTGIELDAAFFVWVAVMMSATSNAVNLTDGLDGLASGSIAMVFAAFVIIAFWQFRHTCEAMPFSPSCYDVDLETSLDLAVLSAGAMGAVAGFLWWNAAPAKIFMGDTGSLALGGLVAALAIATRTQLLLVVLGGLYVLETASVVLQVVSFRFFKRRLFRMAPIHHHFEVLGWHEFTVIVRFWIVAGLAVALGLGLFYAEYLAGGGVV